jgi:excisionase family DNA binding protein
MQHDHRDNPDAHAILSTVELAAALRVHPATVRRWVRRGAPSLGIPGGHLRFSVREVMRWLRKGQETQ